MIAKKDPPPTSNKDFTGYIPDLLAKLANQSGCNCRFNLELVADGKYGVVNDQGGWNGMIGALLDGVSAILHWPHVQGAPEN